MVEDNDRTAYKGRKVQVVDEVVGKVIMNMVLVGVDNFSFFPPSTLLNSKCDQTLIDHSG